MGGPLPGSATREASLHSRKHTCAARGGFTTEMFARVLLVSAITRLLGHARHGTGVPRDMQNAHALIVPCLGSRSKLRHSLGGLTKRLAWRGCISTSLHARRRRRGRRGGPLADSHRSGTECAGHAQARRHRRRQKGRPCRRISAAVHRSCRSTNCHRSNSSGTRGKTRRPTHHPAPWDPLNEGRSRLRAPFVAAAADAPARSRSRRRCSFS